MVSAFASFESVVRGAQQQVQADARHFAEAWKTEKVIYMMGSGPSFGAAHQESICILLEMQWINSASIHSGEYFHGPFEITETGTPFILLKSSGRTRPLDDRAIRFIERYQENCRLLTWKRWESTHCTPACANISAACCTTAYWMFTTWRWPPLATTR